MLENSGLKATHYLITNYKYNPLNCYIFNAHSLKNKLLDLHHFLHVINADCVFITESWLNGETVNDLIHPSCEYSVLRCDCADELGKGEVCITDNNNLHIKEVEIGMLDSHVELLRIDVPSASVWCTDHLTPCVICMMNNYLTAYCINQIMYYILYCLPKMHQNTTFVTGHTTGNQATRFQID